MSKAVATAAVDAAAAGAQAMVAPPFPVGMNAQYLPRFSIYLQRTPYLSPYFAKFGVPLWFSKLDLRDYLYHAYGVRTFAIRSYVQQQKVQQGKGDRAAPQRNRWYRPQAKKFMTVELERPFVWPDEPTDYSAWSKDEMEKMMEVRDEMMETMGPTKDTVVNETRREKMRDQAQALLEGRVKWEPSKSRALG